MPKATPNLRSPYDLVRSTLDPGQITYRDTVRTYREQRSSDPIFTEHPWQACIAFEELMQEAVQIQTKRKKEKKPPLVVRILSGSFPFKVYGRQPLQKLFIEFFDVGGQCKILVWNEKLGANKVLVDGLSKIAHERGGKCDWLLSKISRFGDVLSHLFLVDETAYRIESPHPPVQHELMTETMPSIPSRLCFNDRSGGKDLANGFDSLWELIRSRQG